MRDVNILLPKLLAQTLTQAPQRELAGRERARRHVPAQAPRRAREDERAALAPRVERVLLERLHRRPRERERAVHVHVRHVAQLLGRHGEERPTRRKAQVMQHDAQLCRAASGPGVCEDGRERGGHVFVAVGLGEETGRLRVVSGVHRTT